MTELMTDPLVADPGRRRIRRALVSVYDKSGLAQIGALLVDAGVELVSTGSTARTLVEAGLPVTPVEQVTGFIECLDGRVKTLHPHIHAGLLADLRLDSHVAQLSELGIAPFELLISNLYPFRDTVASGASPDACVEQIDIGGPAMVRAAAKNHASVAVITAPEQYPTLRGALGFGGFTLAQRQGLAATAFAHTASYDVAVASWMGQELTDSGAGTGLPVWAGATWSRAAVLRYGENPHQRAALYRDLDRDQQSGGLAGARQLHGKEMSYNNYVDADAARRAAYDFDAPAVAIIKHANPCGIAIGADIAEAHRRAHACDPVSAFGGVVAANLPVSAAMAGQIGEIFTEVVVAPASRRAPWRFSRPRRTSGCSRWSRRNPAPDWRYEPSTGGSWSSPAMWWEQTMIGPRTGSWSPVNRLGRSSWPISNSPGPRYGRSSRTPSCSPGTGPR